MVGTNAFAHLAQSIPPSIMQWFVIIMILCVVIGTLYDVLHKGSMKYFFTAWRRSRDKGKRPVAGGEVAGLAVKTLTNEVLTSSEFCNPKRRMAHLLTMYGFILYVIASAVLIFSYPTSLSAGIWPLLWTIGALMVAVGGYWFWFFIRVDVAAEGSSPLRVMHADLFILSLLASVTFGLVWAWLQGPTNTAGSLFFLGLYIIATAVLFGGVPWSKFSHMFFKPAAALEKKLSMASGFAQNLPTISRDDPEQRRRHSMELLQNAPMDMGLGIKREEPRHY
jgi:hypothetical protein